MYCTSRLFLKFNQYCNCVILILLSNNSNQKFSFLTRAIAGIVDDHSMVAFLPLDITDEESIDLILMNADHNIQYGEDLEPQALDGGIDDNDNISMRDWLQELNFQLPDLIFHLQPRNRNIYVEINNFICNEFNLDNIHTDMNLNDSKGHSSSSFSDDDKFCSDS